MCLYANKVSLIFGTTKTMYLNALVSDKEEFDRKDALLRSINAQVQSFKDSIR